MEEDLATKDKELIWNDGELVYDNGDKEEESPMVPNHEKIKIMNCQVPRTGRNKYSSQRHAE